LQCSDSLGGGTGSSERRNQGYAGGDSGATDGFLVEERVGALRGVNDQLDSVALDQIDNVGAAFFYFVHALAGHAGFFDDVGGAGGRDQFESHVNEFSGDLGKVYVLEVNPRASRTVPYVSKATGIPMAKIAARLMTGRKLREFLPENIDQQKDLDTGSFYYVKSPVFPWNKFPGVDTVLGPEMKSTGEVMGVADNFGEAFAKAQIAAGQKLPTQGYVFVSVTDHDKPHVAEVARKFVDMGFKLVATTGTADVIEEAGMACERVYKVKEGRPNVVDLIKGDRIQLIVNTPQGPDPFFDEKAIRRAAVTARIPTITTLAAARAAAEGIAALQRGEVNVRALQQLHAERVATK